MGIGWRLVKKPFAERAFDGEGARLYGGRWNSPGTRMVYLSGSAALATLEILVHVQNRLLIDSYCLIGAEFDDALVRVLGRDRLPKGWNSYPAPRETQRLGDEWFVGRESLLLRVPSVVIPSEHNFLLNPLHEDFHRLRIGEPVDFPLDARLIQ